MGFIVMHAYFMPRRTIQWGTFSRTGPGSLFCRSAKIGHENQMKVAVKWAEGLGLI